MGRKNPHVASLDEVRISRSGDDAFIEYADAAVPTIRLAIGPQLCEMSDEDVLELHNDTVRRMERVAAETDHVAIEIPLGRPQLRRRDSSSPWIPRGDLVRAIVDRGTSGEPMLQIDDQTLSLEDLGRMLSTFAGWGMRMVFVPREEIHHDPLIDVLDPDRLDEKPWRARAASRTTANRRRRKVAVPRAAVYQLRVRLLGSDPPIWRRLLVSSNRSLKTLHDILQAAMGWNDTHMHRFVVPAEGRAFSDPRFQLDEAENEGRVKLRTVLMEAGEALRYQYDFGDQWEHEVVLEEILDAADCDGIPLCVDGRRACPPEDCGGMAGYFDFLAAIRDPSHQLHREAMQWWGRNFDAERFDPEAVNKRLRRFR